MKAASLFLVTLLAVGGSTVAQAAISPGTPSLDRIATASPATAPIVLAKNGADNPPGDDHGGKGGKGRGNDDGAHHH